MRRKDDRMPTCATKNGCPLRCSGRLMSSASGAAEQQLAFLQQRCGFGNGKAAPVRLSPVSECRVAADQNVPVCRADVGILHIRRIAHRAVQDVLQVGICSESLCDGSDEGVFARVHRRVFCQAALQCCLRGRQ